MRHPFAILLATILLAPCLCNGELLATYTASGTFTVPNGVSNIVVECYGGGAAGSFANGINGFYGGTGGGGGAYAKAQLTVSANQQFAVTVGTGGASVGA